MRNKMLSIYERFPPSEPCDCATCLFFCNRPGWWLVAEAREAIARGYATKMMLEFAPDHSLGVLSPAFKGNEGYFALQAHSSNRCTFFNCGQCVIFGETFRPLECRFCHHNRLGEGKRCHEEIEHDWDTSKGRRLVRLWASLLDLRLPLS